MSLPQITFEKKGSLDAIFATSNVTKLAAVGASAPGKPGQGMYHGAVSGPLKDKHIYLVPKNAKRAARFDPVNMTWESFGDVFEGGDKWVGGALSSFDNCIYCMPSSLTAVQKVLRIDPAKGTAKQIGNSVQSLTGGVKSYAWHGTVAAADGRIYGIPHTATTVLCLDPRTGELSTFGNVQKGDNKYWSGILGPSGRFIFCIPALASRVLCIDTKARTAELIGDDFGQGSVWHRDSKWRGGGIGRDGCLYCIPITGCVRQVLRIDPRSKATSLFGPTVEMTAFGFNGGCGGPDGCVYGTPHQSQRVLCINPKAGTVSAVGDAIPGDVHGKLAGAVLGPDGSVWFLPTHLPARMLRMGGQPQIYAGEAVETIGTHRETLQQCFVGSDGLRDTILRMLDQVLSLKVPARESHPVESSNPPKNYVAAHQKAIGDHLQRDWPHISAALQAVHRTSKEAFPSKDRITFLSHIAKSSTILHGSDTSDTWLPLPESPVDWSWPPPPLAPLRKACKVVQALSPDVLQFVWPALAGAIMMVLICMLDAVRDDMKGAKILLTTVFDRERNASLETYHKQLRRARRDPTFPEFKATAARMLDDLISRRRQEQYRLQSTASFPTLRANAHAIYDRFNAFLAKLCEKCVGAKRLKAPIKGTGRALEKMVLRRGAIAKIKADGVEALDATKLVDILRGSINCPDFTEIVFLLELLLLLDVGMGNAQKAQAAGWNLDDFQIRLIHMKDRFSHPTSGGWADMLVNFSFAHGDETHHVMELQLQHQQMLVVRKAGKAHNQYNSFRSAFELLESVGSEPHDEFVETDEDLPPMERLEKKVNKQMEFFTQQIRSMQREISELKKENKTLRSRLDNNNIE